MANFYDMNAAIQKPNVLGAMQQGLQFGQQQRVLREQRADQQQLRTLAPQIQQGDLGAFRQAAAFDPQAASAQLSAGDLVTRRMEPLVRLLEEADARNPQEAQALWQSQGVPFVRQFSQGSEPTTDWQQAKPMLAQLKTKIEMAKSTQASADPTGFRELHMKALAAGYRPGTTEYQNAMRVGIGTEGRAPTGGFGFEEVIGPDGRKRVQRRNPRTGQVEVYDESTGEFAPMGGAGSLDGMAPAAGPTINIEGIPQERQQQISQAVASLRALNVPDDQIDAFVQQQAYAQPQFVTPSGTPAPRSAILGAGPTEAETEAAKAAARGEVEIGLLPERGRIEAQIEGEKAAARQAAETAAERSKTAIAKAPQLQNVERGLDRIEQALTALEGGVVGDTGPLDQYYQRFTKEGQELEGAVGAIQNDMLALTRVPGIGSQSDLEAKIANLKYPSLSNDPSVNRRNVQQLRAFMRDLAESLGRAPSKQGAQQGWSIQRVP